jgi:hypothetical protein
MSGYREQPFHVSKGDQDAWVVDFAGKPVFVDSRDDAILLAELPVQLYRAISKDRRHDLDKIRRILGLCDEYHLGRFWAVRELKSRFKRNHRQLGGG